MKKSCIRVGARCRIVPVYRYGGEPENALVAGDPGTVTGTIIYVNHAHRYFRVEFPAGSRGKTLTECLKF